MSIYRRPIYSGNLIQPSLLPQSTRSRNHVFQPTEPVCTSFSALRREGIYPNALSKYFSVQISIRAVGDLAAAITSSGKMPSWNLRLQSSSSKPSAVEASMAHEKSRAEVRNRVPFTMKNTISQLNLSSNLENPHDPSLITTGHNPKMHSMTGFVQVGSRSTQNESCQHSQRLRNVHLSIRNK